MRGGTIVDATIIAAPSPVKNAAGARDPQMRQALKGNQWYFGMKAHVGVDAGAGYQGASKRPDVADDPHLSQGEFRIAARKSKLAAMAQPDRVAESRKASVRAKVEHPFLIIKRDFGFTKTRYRGMAKNLNHLNVLFASANWVMRARAVALMG